MSTAEGPAASDYDVIIIGGGINGAGIARDCGLRGVRSLLLEARDFGSGTSSWSTRLIHGGLRYLEYAEIGLVRESLHERRRLLAQAPHLVQPICLSIPVYRGARRGPLIVRLGMIAYDLLSLGKSLPAHCMLDARQMQEAEPGLAAEGLRGGAQYYDGQITFAERLVLENVIDAAAAGVDVRNYAEVLDIRRDEDGLFHVGYGDAGGFARSRVLVNAAGPWVDSVLAATNQSVSRLMGGTKGSHIVVGRFPGAPRQAIYVEAASDGRPIFIIPWNGQYLIGTTDIRIEGDPGEARASDAEIAYLLDEANRVLPNAGLSIDDIHFTYSGVRPLPFREEGPESAITRRHIIREHGGDLSGLISIIGGKLTTYRSLAEQATDAVCSLLGGRHTGCATRERPLPGGRDFSPTMPVPQVLKAAAPNGDDRLRSIYGSRLARLKVICEEEPSLAKAIDDSGRVLAAEVVFGLREEYARTLTDLLYRRLMVGLAGELDAMLVDRVLDIAAAEAGWDDALKRRQLEDLAALNRRLRRRS